jgi:CDP-glucose 4,6-dehydratase
LSLWLHALGADVTGYALDPPTEPSLFCQARVEGTLSRSIRGDIRDFAALKDAIDSAAPDVVIHMAAQSVVRRSYENPIETYSSNVMGTLHVFEALRQLGRRCVVVNVTTDKCYENREWVWGYRENERMGGRDPYSNSKGCVELLTASYRDSFFPAAEYAEHGVAIGCARAGNAIGGGDWTRNQLIPDLIRGFIAGEPCTIRNPASVRPWQFVLEPLRGYLTLAERLADDVELFGSGWNFGPVESDAQPVSMIADELARLWGEGAAWALDGNGRHPHESHFLKLDASKAAAYLGWRPALPLRSALQWIVEWYRGLASGADLQHLTRAQIERYEGLLSN